MKLVSMKIAPKEMDTAKMPAPDPYPYGLRIELNDDVLEALGISKLPAVGDYVMIEARCCVKSTAENEYDGEGKRRSMSVQIEKLAVSPDDEDKSDKLYRKG
jgi:hypothetical protein